MERKTSDHLSAGKRILCYQKGNIELGLYYYGGYSDKDFVGDADDIKSM